MLDLDFSQYLPALYWKDAHEFGSALHAAAASDTVPRIAVINPYKFVRLSPVWSLSTVRSNPATEAHALPFLFGTRKRGGCKREEGRSYNLDRYARERRAHQSTSLHGRHPVVPMHACMWCRCRVNVMS